MLGLGGELRYGGGQNPLSAGVRLVFEQELGDDTARQRATFAGSATPFTVFSPDIRNSGVGVGIGLGYRIAPSITLQARYDGSINHDANRHRGSVGLSMGF